MSVRWLALAALLCSCGAAPETDTAEQAVITSTHVGGIGHVDVTTTSALSGLYLYAKMPLFPVAPSSSSSFSGNYLINNGGTPGINYNALAFQFGMTNAGANSTFWGTAVGDFVDTVGTWGHSTHVDLSIVYAPAGGALEWYWDGSYFSVAAYNAAGVLIDYQEEPWSWGLGTMPKRVFSPVVFLSLKTGGGYDGCRYDTPADNQNPEHETYFSIVPWYDSGTQYGYAPLTFPTSQSLCSMTATNHASDSVVTWVTGL